SRRAMISACCRRNTIRSSNVSWEISRRRFHTYRSSTRHATSRVSMVPPTIVIAPVAKDEAMSLLITWIANSLAIYAVAYLMGGVQVASVRDAFLAGAVLSLVNLIVKPIIFVLTLPFTIVTLGLF